MLSRQGWIPYHYTRHFIHHTYTLSEALLDCKSTKQHLQKFPQNWGGISNAYILQSALKELALTFTHNLNQWTSQPSNRKHWQSERQRYLRGVVRTICGRVSYKHVQFSKPINIVPRRIFGPKRDEVTGEWRKLNNDELNDLHSSSNIVWLIKSTIMRWAGHVGRMMDSRGIYRVLVGKPEGQRPLGRPSRRWELNIKMYFEEVGCWECWTGSSWLRKWTVGRLLWMFWTIVFHKMWGITWLAENRLPSHEWLCSVE